VVGVKGTRGGGIQPYVIARDPSEPRWRWWDRSRQGRRVGRWKGPRGRDAENGRCAAGPPVAPSRPVPSRTAGAPPNKIRAQLEARTIRDDLVLETILAPLPYRRAPAAACEARIVPGSCCFVFAVQRSKPRRIPSGHPRPLPADTLRSPDLLFYSLVTGALPVGDPSPLLAADRHRWSF
jgi:hypothetical protein